MADEPVITFDNPSYRDWLLQKARDAVTPQERDRLLALADGDTVTFDELPRNTLANENELLKRLKAKGAVKPPQTGKHPSE